MYIAKEIQNVVGSNTEAAVLLQRLANRIARQNNYWIATSVVLGNKNRIIEHIRHGYRKYTTGEYVSNSYIKNFGWKNTYYQHAHTVVEINIQSDMFLKLQLL